jgi:hypothetical protein
MAIRSDTNHLSVRAVLAVVCWHPDGQIAPARRSDLSWRPVPDRALVELAAAHLASARVDWKRRSGQELQAAAMV